MHLLVPRIATFAALATAIVAIPMESVHKLHEKRGTPLQAWVKRSKVEPTMVLPVRIGLKQNNIHLGHDLLMEMYVSLQLLGSGPLDWILIDAQFKARLAQIWAALYSRGNC